MSNDLKLQYDSVHYRGKNLIKAGYFLAIIAQPGVNKFTLQTTCLLIECVGRKPPENVHELLSEAGEVQRGVEKLVQEEVDKLKKGKE